MLILARNPYSDINWPQVDRYRANFHQHSTESDGREYPSILADQAATLGLDIFGISDHDSYRINRGKYPKVLAVDNPERPNGLYINIWPLTEFESDVYYDPSEAGDYSQLARVGTAGEFVRNADGIISNGLLTIEMNELTQDHNALNHIVSMMNNYDGFPGNDDEESAFAKISSAGGLGFFAHPPRHWDVEKAYLPQDRFSPEYYLSILKNYESCLGLEAYTFHDGYPSARILWDRILSRGIDATPVWGFSNTDSHGACNLRNHNVIFMENLTETELRTRLIQGNFYCCYQTDANNFVAPIIQEITVNENQKTITITSEPGCSVHWVSCGHIIARGHQLSYSDTPGISRYVRAVVSKGSNVSLTNPFIFSRFVEPSSFVNL